MREGGLLHTVELNEELDGLVTTVMLSGLSTKGARP